MKNNWFYCLLSIFLFSVSCNRADEVKLLKTSENLVQRIPCDSNLFGKLYSYFKPLNSNNLYFLNQTEGDVYVLNGQSFKFSKILESKVAECETFSVDEKNNGVVLFTIDSFYIFRNEKLVKRSVIPEFKNGVLFYDDFSFKPILDGENLHLMYYSKVFEAYKNKNFYDKNFECIFNFRTNELKILNVTYPKSFRAYCVGHYFLPDRYALNKENNLYFYKRLDSITVYDKTKNESKVVFCGSREPKVFKTLKFSELSKYNKSVFNELNMTNPLYLLSGVLNKHKIVFRFYTKSLKDYNKSKKLRLVLYDSDLNYIGETIYKKQNLIMFENENRMMSVRFYIGYIACYEFSYR